MLLFTFDFYKLSAVYVDIFPLMCHPVCLLFVVSIQKRGKIVHLQYCADFQLNHRNRSLSELDLYVNETKKYFYFVSKCI